MSEISARDFGRLESTVKEIHDMVKAQSTQLRALELADAKQTGKQSVIGFLVSAVTAGIVAWTSKHFA